jgi:glycosyltransferase involved in cell wall biosynthesis
VSATLRVFIGYHEVAGYCRGLETALEAAGARAHFCDVCENEFYERGKATRVERALRGRIERQNSGRDSSRRGRLKDRAIKALFFLELLLRYDAFVLVGRYTPLGLRDRSTLRRLGKKVISVFLGSDSRPLFQSGAFLDRFRGDWESLERAVRRQFEEVRAIERGSDAVVCHAPTSLFLSRPFARFLAMGFPFDPGRIEGIARPKFVGAKDAAIRVIHAPSAPQYKGTDEIVRIVEELRGEGIQIEMDLIVNRPNREVLKALADCDFVIDELYSDTPLAGLAVEAAAFGKPSVVGTYAVSGDLIEERLPPSAISHPRSVKGAIRALATDGFEREALGERAREFLETRWSPLEVGRRFLALIAGEASEDWFSDPRRTTYVFGWGVEEEALRRDLRDYADARGLSALCLDDKPAALRAVATFISAGMR